MPETIMHNLNQRIAGQTAVSRLGEMWCDLMHDAPMWPIHGQYECRTCGRRHRVGWA